MPEAALSGTPVGHAIHGTAVSIAGDALLILGRSRAGKSRLALALIAASTPDRPIRLVGDDRILLVEGRNGLVARPHPRIAGFIERRGLGLVAVDHVGSASLRGVVVLGACLVPAPGLDALAMLKLDAGLPDAGEVLTWWRDASTTHAAKPFASPCSGKKN